MVPALAAGGTEAQIEVAVGVTVAGREGRLTVLGADGLVVGPDIERSPAVNGALVAGASAISTVDGGVEVVTAVASGPGQRAAIRVFVPNSTLRRGQWRAWGALVGMGVLLVMLSVVVADRLARTVVLPTRQLALAARRLGDGDLTATVEPEGPEELVGLAVAFNELGSQVASMLDRERELVAELSHRLRTPLTKLRMRVDTLDDPELADDLRSDVGDLAAVVDDVISEARGSLGAESGCDVIEVVSERVEFWRVLADDQRRPWYFRRTDGTATVHARRPELAAAVDVLLENTFAHTPEGTAVSIEIVSGSGWVHVAVGDAGPGLEPGSGRRGESAAGSTGLGLDIARRFAEVVGGELDLGTSELGGAEVVLWLPLVSGGWAPAPHGSSGSS